MRCADWRFAEGEMRFGSRCCQDQSHIEHTGWEIGMKMVVRRRRRFGCFHMLACFCNVRRILGQSCDFLL